MLEVEDLTMRYPMTKTKFGLTYKTALKDVCFTLDDGLYGLLGPNGAGKSTLINILTDSLKQTKGRVYWNGENVHKMGKDFRRILGYMPQQQNLYESFTGQQFLSYVCALKEIPACKAKTEILSAADSVHMTDVLHRRLRTYSGGMKQRLLIAAALIGKPQLLILDEPTAGLDPKERIRLRQMLASLAENRTILVATHVVSDIETVAKEILLLKEGTLVRKAPPTQLIDEFAPGGRIEDVYLALFGEE